MTEADRTDELGCDPGAFAGAIDAAVGQDRLHLADRLRAVARQFAARGAEGWIVRAVQQCAADTEAGLHALPAPPTPNPET